MGVGEPFAVASVGEAQLSFGTSRMGRNSMRQLELPVGIQGITSLAYRPHEPSRIGSGSTRIRTGGGTCGRTRGLYCPMTGGHGKMLTATCRRSTAARLQRCDRACSGRDSQRGSRKFDGSGAIGVPDNARSSSTGTPGLSRGLGSSATARLKRSTTAPACIDLRLLRTQPSAACKSQHKQTIHRRVRTLACPHGRISQRSAQSNRAARRADHESV